MPPRMPSRRTSRHAGPRAGHRDPYRAPSLKYPPRSASSPAPTWPPTASVPDWRRSWRRCPAARAQPAEPRAGRAAVDPRLRHPRQLRHPRRAPGHVDGIPATMPDGQGQVSHFPLATAERIEIVRGPFSALYGNAAGGVIQLFTADGAAPNSIGGALAAGGFGQRRASVDTRGAGDALAWTLGALRFATDGYRAHSRAEHASLNGKLALDRGRWYPTGRCCSTRWKRRTLAGSAGSDARAAGGRSAPGRRRRARLQHAQVGLATAVRRRARTRRRRWRAAARAHMPAAARSSSSSRSRSVPSAAHSAPAG